MKHLQTRELIRELARNNGLSVAEVTAILDSIPKFLREVMSTKPDKENGYFPTIRVQGLGTFYVDDKVKHHIQRHILDEKAEEQNEITRVHEGDYIS